MGYIVVRNGQEESGKRKHNKAKEEGGENKEKAVRKEKRRTE